MKYGFVLPTNSDARTTAEFAHHAEAAGWDGFFVWEPVWGFDAWVSLSAAAMRTERIRLGTLLSPLSRMRPWKIAGETVNLDHLSNARVILSVGLGHVPSGFDKFGEEGNRKIRAELLDEALDILTGLWGGQPFSYQGKHYQVTDEPIHSMPPPPLQKPRIPIWVVGVWPRMKSMRRVLRYDGLLPAVMGGNGKFRETTPDDIRTMKAFVEEKRTDTTPFDIIAEGETPDSNQEETAAIVRPWADAGATWWIETRWNEPGNSEGLKAVRRRIQQGPPTLK